MPEEVRRRHPFAEVDVDSLMFLDHFRAPAGGKVLCVGAHDERTSIMMAEAGCLVEGVDLRPWDGPSHPNFLHHVFDFCDPPAEWLKARWGKFDVAVALSCLEHFGLGTYGESQTHPFLDVVAARLIWHLLRPGGRAYVTVPMGNCFMVKGPHWRVYDLPALWGRLIQDFEVEYVGTAVSGPALLRRENRSEEMVRVGDPITWVEAANYGGDPPHLSVLLILKKGLGKRQADADKEPSI